MKFLPASLLLSAALSLTSVGATCPSVPTADSKFELNSYLGKWYEVAKNANFAKIFERNGYCITAEYSMNDDGSIKVDNGMLKGGPSGEYSDAVAKAKQTDPENSPAKLGVSFFLDSFDFSYQDYWIVDLVGSAAENYQVAVVYSCTTTLGLFDNTNMWVLSRTPTLPEDFPLDVMYQRAKDLNIDVEALNMIENDITGCFQDADAVATEDSVSVFDGDYTDPNHPGCARSVSVASDGVTAAVSGEDGDEGSLDCANAVAWGPLEASINGMNIKIDFSPKGGPSDLTAEYDVEDDGILFSDGNLWAKIE